MKITTYIKQHDDNTEEIVYISEPIDMSNRNINILDIFKKMQKQRSHILKDKVLTYMELLLK